jgi:hypothetical protein
MASDQYGNQWYQPISGLGSVGSYQSSAIPWVTSSVQAPSESEEPLKISFPTVTRFLTVKNDVDSVSKLRVGFSRNGVVESGNYFLLAKGESFTSEMRVVDVYLRSDDGVPVDVTIVAGLTTIPRSSLASNWSGSAGVG